MASVSSNSIKVKLKAGKFLVGTTLTYSGGRIYLSFPFNRSLLTEVKMMQGAIWHGILDR